MPRRICLNSLPCLLLTVAVVLTGCIDQPIEQQSSAKGNPTPVAWAGTVTGNGADCGVVIDKQLKNPPDPGDAIAVTLESVVDAEFYILHVTAAGGNVLIKSIGAETTNRQGAAEYIQSLIPRGTQLQLYRAGEACDVKAPGGGVGTMGTLILPDGRSLTEILLLQGYLRADSASSYCSGNVIEKCFREVQSAGIKISPYSVTSFLWKPASAEDGKAVIINSSPWSKMSINGQEYQHPQGVETLRFSRPGCAFGRVTLRSWDREGRPMAWPDGKLEYVIPDGCKRTEWGR